MYTFLELTSLLVNAQHTLSPVLLSLKPVLSTDCENTLLYKTWKVIKSILDTMGLEPTTSTNTSMVGKAHTITTKLS